MCKNIENDPVDVQMCVSLHNFLDSKLQTRQYDSHFAVIVWILKMIQRMYDNMFDKYKMYV